MLKKKKKTKLSRVWESDQRGHASNHKTEEAVTNQIKEHIMLFKMVESHYIRKDSQCQYLPDHLSISEMYRLYGEWCKANAFKAASYGLYHNVFKTQFNPKFHKPKKDQCDKCVGYNNTAKHLLTDEMKSKQQKHIAEKDLARLHKDTVKKEAANDATILRWKNKVAVNLKTGRFDNINLAVIISSVCRAVQNCKN